MKKEEVSEMLNKVDDAIGYFSWRFDELKHDDVYYIEWLVKYIDYLEQKVDNNKAKQWKSIPIT